MSDELKQSVALTIAGSDSGGGAGIEADLRAFRDFGVHGCVAVTAVTAQNPHGVRAVEGLSPAMVQAQIEAVMEDFSPLGAVKTGMLLNAGIITAVAEAFEKMGHVPRVVDPVMVATSGARLLDAAAGAVLQKRLLPQATLLTPNVPEARELLHWQGACDSPAALAEMAAQLQARFGVAVLVKGGHLPQAPAVDVLAERPGEIWQLAAPAIEHPLTTHGTGCTLASAIAANLALGRPLREAVRAAKAYLLGLLTAGVPVGRTAVYGFAGKTFSEAAVVERRV